MIKRTLMLIAGNLVAATTELFKTSDSEVCKRECIDESNHFCPYSDGFGGVCCSDTNCD